MAKASKVESSTAKSVIRLTLHVLSGFVLFMNNSSASAQTFFRLPPTDITIHNPDSTKVNETGSQSVLLILRMQVPI